MDFSFLGLFLLSEENEQTFLVIAQGTQLGKCIIGIIYIYIWPIYMVEYCCVKAEAGGPMRGNDLTKEHCIIECKPIYIE